MKVLGCISEDMYNELPIYGKIIRKICYNKITIYRWYIKQKISNWKTKNYIHKATNHWILFEKIGILLIHPHERYPNIIRWNKNFNRLKIGSKLEFQFGKIPPYFIRYSNAIEEKP